MAVPGRQPGRTPCRWCRCPSSAALRAAASRRRWTPGSLATSVCSSKACSSTAPRISSWLLDSTVRCGPAWPLHCSSAVLAAFTASLQSSLQASSWTQPPASSGARLSRLPLTRMPRVRTSPTRCTLRAQRARLRRRWGSKWCTSSRRTSRLRRCRSSSATSTWCSSTPARSSIDLPEPCIGRSFRRRCEGCWQRGAQLRAGGSLSHGCWF
mmetsp:Transcript_11597/g.31447  ORF Transcript_11597/g.31447 Transcript_11597/m.31447 type:complete len:211 (+) Transcript_11597:130-762(+)